MESARYWNNRIRIFVLVRLSPTHNILEVFYVSRCPRGLIGLVSHSRPKPSEHLRYTLDSDNFAFAEGRGPTDPTVYVGVVFGGSTFLERYLQA